MIKNFETKVATLSPGENSGKNEKITNWIELSNLGLAKDFNKLEVTRMKVFETGVNDLPKFDFESFKGKPRLSKAGKYLFIK